MTARLPFATVATLVCDVAPARFPIARGRVESSPQPRHNRHLLRAGFLWLSVALLGGAGCEMAPGVDPTTPNAPSLTLTPQTVKTFHFTWSDVSGETEYRLLENPDGASGHTQVASVGADVTAHDLIVSLPARINASYILQACNEAGCSDSAEVFVSGTLVGVVGYAKASNADAGDRFGVSLALALADGTTLAVGAFGEASAATGIGGNQNDNSADLAGAVYLY